jgi:hypothetical protein
MPEIHAYSIAPDGNGNFEATLAMSADGSSILKSIHATEEEAQAWITAHLQFNARVRTLCCVCGFVLVDVPADERGISHGFCRDCCAEYRVAYPDADTAPERERCKAWRYGHKR